MKINKKIEDGNTSKKRSRSKGKEKEKEKKSYLINDKKNLIIFYA